eukprot:g29276.t1
MSAGTSSLATFFCFYCLAYVCTELAAPVAAWAGMFVFCGITLLLLRTDQILSARNYFVGSIFLFFSPDKLESLLAEYHGELMQKLMLQELMLKQMLPVLQYGHLSYGYEIDPEPPGPSKDSKTKDAGDFSEGLGPLPDQKNSRLSLMKANTVPVSFKEDGEQLFSTFHAEDLNRVEMADAQRWTQGLIELWWSFLEQDLFFKQ